MIRKPSRDTAQRRAIRQVLVDLGRPLSTAEILRAAQRTVPGLGLATVYRTVRSLQVEGVLQQVDLPGDVPRYEITTPRHHHHFQCTRCGRVFEVDACPGNLAHMVPRGFVADNHEVILYGRCRDCAGQARSRRAPHARRNG